MTRFKWCLAVLLAAGVVPATNVQAADNDHDGVPDAQDSCPDTAQLGKLPADFKYSAAVNPARLQPGAQAFPVDRRGCEYDSDRDGVIDSRDYCPDDTPAAIALGVAANGCPKHSDADGTPDYRDRCPGTPAHVRTDRYGCAVPG
ncbi:MAG: thrombospondin type 3 repeat-containing protein [Pseudomonadota bacterium]